jgi:hypothetical protein
MRYACRWTVPHGAPEESITRNLGPEFSGWGRTFVLDEWTGCVDADDEQDARAKIAAVFGPAGKDAVFYDVEQVDDE